MLVTFEYKCLVDIVIGKYTQPPIACRDRDKYDEQQKEAVTLIKLFVTDEMLPKVQTWKTSTTICKHLRELHENSDKDITFFLKNMLFLITMNENASLQDNLFKIKDIREQLLTIVNRR
jgi:hypothetical protein